MTFVLGLAACARGPTPAETQALHAAQQAASECQEWLHDGAADFSECLRFVAAHPAAGQQPSWWALGALHYGWLMQDVVALAGTEGADEQARALVREAETLRTALRAPDAALCPLIDVPCERQRQRRNERLAGR